MVTEVKVMMIMAQQWLVIMPFDGLASETKFIHSFFMNSSSQTITVTGCNHVAKNMYSQLVFGSDIGIGRNSLFYVGILMIVGINADLCRVDNCTSDTVCFETLQQWYHC